MPRDISVSKQTHGLLTFEVAVVPTYFFGREQTYERPPNENLDARLLEFALSQSELISVEIKGATDFGFAGAVDATVSIREGSVLVEILLVWNAAVGVKDIAETFGWYREHIHGLLDRIFRPFEREINDGQYGTSPPAFRVFVSDGTFLPATRGFGDSLRYDWRGDSASGLVLWYLIASNAALVVALVVIAIILSE